MEDRESIKPGIHYHILWSNSSLDWKPVETKEEATVLARRIKKRNESVMTSANGANV
jgi:hypothetical protein